MNFTLTKELVFSLLFFHITFSLFAQTATIKGTITDVQNQDILIGATVRSTAFGAVSDYDGNYELELPAGNHELIISYVGYETQKMNITLADNEVKVLNFELGERSTLLQTATVTSGKYEKPLSELTVSMEVIKPQLAEAINTTSIDEVLQKVPGVEMIDGQANIRGGSGWSYGAGSRVLLLVDDIPALQADAGFPNWDDIPVESLEQLEVVKGAASALYGSSALNGIINARTAYAKAEPETKIATFATVYLDPKNKELVWYDSQPYEAGLSVVHKQKIDKLDLVISGYGLHRRGFRENTKSDYGRITFSPRYRISDRLTVGFNSNFNRGKSESYFYWKGWGNDALRGDTTSYSKSDRFRFYIDPYATYFDRSGNRHKVMSRYFSIDNNNDGGQSNRSHLLYGEYQFQRDFKDLNLVVTAGAVGIYTTVSAPLYGDTTFNTSNIAGYFQIDKKMFERLNLSFGMRYERNELDSPNTINGDTISQETAVESKPVYRFGLNYQITKATFLRASFGQGYRYPTIAEKFTTTSAGIINVVPNASLNSETGWSAEIGIKQGFRVKDWEGFVDIALFQSEYNDMMEFVFVQDPSFGFGFQSQNVGNTRIRGVDFSVAAQGDLLGTKTSLLAGYTYIDPKFQEFTFNDSINSSVDYNILKYRNKHSFKIDVETQIKHFSIGLASNYRSHMEAIDAIFEFFIPGLRDHRMDDTNGSITFDARVAYRFFDNRAKVSIIALNLFNELYTLRPALIEAPTNVTLRLDYRF